MNIVGTFTEYLKELFNGHRAEAQEIVFRALERGIPSNGLLKGIIWPAMEQIDKLYRGNHISRIVEHMAARINRTIADQLQTSLATKPKTGRRMIVTCGDGEAEELGAQIMADLFQAEGWTVWFLGAGVPNDEVLEFVGKVRPDILCIYGAKPAGVPHIRKLIETVRSVNSCDQMQILVAGGVFNRAPGLADEVKADLYAPDAQTAMEVVVNHPVRVPRPDVPEPGRRRKLKKARKITPAMRRARAAVA